MIIFIRNEDLKTTKKLNNFTKTFHFITKFKNNIHLHTYI